MKTSHVSIAIFLFIVFLLVPAAGLWAQQDVELTPLQQDLYDMGFGIFTEEVEAPEFTVSTLNGEEASLADYEGKLILLNLWATWCPPCRAEMPSMQALYDELESDGFTILALAAPNPPRETEEKIRQHIADNNFTFPVLVDSEYTAYRIYNTGSIPTSYLINTKGNLVARLTGAIEWDTPEMQAVLEKMLP